MGAAVDGGGGTAVVEVVAAVVDDSAGVVDDELGSVEVVDLARVRPLLLSATPTCSRSGPLVAATTTPTQPTTTIDATSTATQRRFDIPTVTSGA